MNRVTRIQVKTDEVAGALPYDNAAGLYGLRDLKYLFPTGHIKFNCGTQEVLAKISGRSIGGENV